MFKNFWKRPRKFNLEVNYDEIEKEVYPVDQRVVDFKEKVDKGMLRLPEFMSIDATLQDEQIRGSGIPDWNACLKQIASIQKQIRFKFRGYTDFDQMFFKIGFNARGKIICVLYDLDRYEYGDDTEIYLFCELNSLRKTVMYLEYQRRGTLSIVDILSPHERLGHGSFMLQALVEIIPFVNAKLMKRNEVIYKGLCKDPSISMADFIFQNESRTYKPIEKVTGNIYASGTCTRESLEKFYDRNGYLKDRKLVRYFSNEVKELN